MPNNWIKETMMAQGKVTGDPKDGNVTNEDGQPLQKTDNPNLLPGLRSTSMNAGDNPPLASATSGPQIPALGLDSPENARAAGLPQKTSEEHARSEEERLRTAGSGSPDNKPPQDKRAEFIPELQAKMQKAQDSLEGQQLGDLGVNHPYWGLTREADEFRRRHGL